MAAILRVKRRNDDEPLSALVIACKRRKTESGEEVIPTPLTAVLKFAATVKSREDDVVENLGKTLSKDELKANYKQHVVDLASKVREQTKVESQNSRYKVVNCFRSLDTAQNDLVNEPITTVIDVEDSVSCSVPRDAKDEKDEKFVYDLYYSQTEDDLLLDQMVSIHPLQDELIFGTPREKGSNSGDECESEDSNSEANWRNDYPDSDHSDGSVDEEDMKKAVQNLKIDSESDLSSDEDFVYGLDEGDVNEYGYKYAKYKARMKAEMDGEDADKESEVSAYSDYYVSDDPENPDD